MPHHWGNEDRARTDVEYWRWWGKAMAIATSVRNVGVSLVIATSSFPGTQAVTAALASALFQTILMAIVALGWGRLPLTVPGTREGRC